jgi:hypothetical protein
MPPPLPLLVGSTVFACDTDHSRVAFKLCDSRSFRLARFSGYPQRFTNTNTMANMGILIVCSNDELIILSFSMAA